MTSMKARFTLTVLGLLGTATALALYAQSLALPASFG